MLESNGMSAVGGEKERVEHILCITVEYRLSINVLKLTCKENSLISVHCLMANTVTVTKSAWNGGIEWWNSRMEWMEWVEWMEWWN